MLTFTAGELERVSKEIFLALGTPDDIAYTIAHDLVEANLTGHDSHGVIRVPTYVNRVEVGQAKPDARPSIVRESATMAVVKGNWAFGQVSAHFATDLVIAKAKEHDIAAASIVECNHIGRLGAYSMRMAEAGMIGMVVTGGFSGAFAGVTPFGGAGRTLGTNPYSFAVPAGKHDAFLADFATSMVAEGKLQVAQSKGALVAEGLLLDAEGHPTKDPSVYYKGGMLLPFGGHKGYAFSLLADLLGSLLGGSEILGTPPHTAGTFMMALRVDAFRPFAEFADAVDKRLDQVKAVPPAPGFEQVLIPGEPEARSKRQREEQGIPLPEETWEKITAAAQKYGVDVEKALGRKEN